MEAARRGLATGEMLWLHFVLLTLWLFQVEAGCPPCSPFICPQDCAEPIPDPCDCCPMLCAASEGEHCSDVHPCKRDLVCTSTTFDNKCLCREDKRLVCGSNNFTYSSICHLNSEKETEKISIKHWGPCEFGPTILTGPTETRAEIGQPVAFDCEAKGFPVPVVTWTFTGKDGKSKVLPGDDEQVAIQVRGGPEQLMVTSWVQLVEARPDNEGSYSCEASSSRGSDGAQAILLVRPPS